MQTSALAVLLLQVAICIARSPPCCDGEIRLMNGNSRSVLPNEGRVEVCHSDQWKTLCDDHWETSDAEVVCTQLGYVREGVQAICHVDSTFGQGSGLILERVNCDGTEPLLINCTLIDYGDQYGYCVHSDDAGVRCAPITNNCTEGEVRLANNSTENEGRVEICVNGFWGTMCPNNSSILDATIICKELGFSEYGAAVISVTGRPLPVRIHDIACTGHEVKLIDCPHDKGIFTCPGCNSTGVHCSYDTAPAPKGLDISLNDQNYATITWQPPRFAKRHGKLIRYSVTCSTAQHGSTLMAETQNTTQEMWLQPYETYQCCTSAVNQAGLGSPSCELIATNDGAPTAPPNNISWLILNSSSVLLFWQAPPTEYQNGIIQGYHIELTDSSTSINYTTEGPFLLVDNLKPNTDYKCSIAAYTITRGPFSLPITISLLPESYIFTNQTVTVMGGMKTRSKHPHVTSQPSLATPAISASTLWRTSKLAESVLNQSTETSTLAMYVLAVVTGALVVILVVISIVFGAAHFHRSYTASSDNGDDAIYDTVDEAKQRSSGDKLNVTNSLSERKQSLHLIISEKSITPKLSDIKPQGSSAPHPDNSNTTEDSNYQPLIPPTKLMNQETKYQCLSPTQEQILGQFENDSTGISCPNSSNMTGDNNYQPLIPPRKMNEDNKYQCLSPTQESTLGQYENGGAGVFTLDMEREKKTTYQSLLQEEQMDSVSSDYQCLTGFTQQPSIPVSPP